MLKRHHLAIPTPSNITSIWNFGSMLGLVLAIQIATGLCLAAQYTPNTINAFETVSNIIRDVNSGWILRTTHANGASIFFLFLYLHMGRGIYYGSYRNRIT